MRPFDPEWMEWVLTAGSRTEPLSSPIDEETLRVIESHPLDCKCDLCLDFVLRPKPSERGVL